MQLYLSHEVVFERVHQLLQLLEQSVFTEAKACLGISFCTLKRILKELTGISNNVWSQPGWMLSVQHLQKIGASVKDSTRNSPKGRLHVVKTEIRFASMAIMDLRMVEIRDHMEKILQKDL